MGADFSSLEDRISALTTQDPNKLKVYLNGFDGHCLRAHSYFGHLMTDITENQTSINSIANIYPDLRQRSKGPTFALTYGGTSHALVKQCGIPLEEAEVIEANYHKLYKVSDDWVAKKVKKGSNTGHMDLAFGLRLRTPIIQQTILNKRSTPYESSKEARTAGNALGQSWGLLNNRSAIEFQERTFNSKYKYKIKPIAHIHDAQYFLVKNEVGVVKWFNDNLVETMEWQKDPAIQHSKVKLEATTSIFHPTWADEIKIPNRANKSLIVGLCKQI